MSTSRPIARIAGWLLIAASLSPLAVAQTRPAATAPAESITVAFLLLDGVYNSELIAPLDVLHHTRFHAKPGMEVFTVGRTTDDVLSFEGLRIGVDHDLDGAPAFDVLVVPSAEHSMDRDLEDERLIAWVRDRGASCRAVMSICDGAFVLAEAGLLNDRYCTTFPSDASTLRERYPDLDVVEGVTFVADGPVITGVGGARSYEPALYLVERLYGSVAARGVARGLVIDWDLERERRLVLREDDPAAPLPASYLPGQTIDPATTIENEDGEKATLAELARSLNAKAIVLTVLAGPEAETVAEHGRLWCEDSRNELGNLRYLKLAYEARGVVFVGVLCPPIHHEVEFGYDEGAFDPGADDELYLTNRRRFVDATDAMRRQDADLPFHVVGFDPRFRLLARRAGDDAATWHGRLKWFEDIQTYGTPTTWVLTPDLEIVGPPFFMNVYESEGRKLRYTPAQVERAIETCLQRR